MGLLSGGSRVLRRAGNFVDGASKRMGERAYRLNFTDDRFAPVSSAAGGAFLGGGVGAVANPDNPYAGALAGAGIGAAGGAGLSVARQLGAGVAGGLRQARELGDANPRAIADEIKQLARTAPAEAQRYVEAISKANPALLEEVMVYLR